MIWFDWRHQQLLRRRFGYADQFIDKCRFWRQPKLERTSFGDGISEWHPSFLQLASSLKGCSRRYARFCQSYRHKSKGGSRCHWGSRMLKRLVEKGRSSQSRKSRVSPGQQKLPFAFDIRLNQIPEKWHQIAVRFRRANGIRDGDKILKLWWLS